MKAYPGKDATALAKVNELIRNFRDEGRLQALAEGVDIMLGHQWGAMIDANRSMVAFDLADSLLDAAAQYSRLDVLEGGLKVVEVELRRMPEYMDLRSEVLLKAMRGALLRERYYLRHWLDDLSAALDDLKWSTDLLDKIPSSVDPDKRAWCWLTYGSILESHAEITHRLDQWQAAVIALDKGVAVKGIRRTVRTAIRWKLAITRVGYWERVLLRDPKAKAHLVEALDLAIAELTNLVDEQPGHDIERASWVQNLVKLHQRRGELDE